MRKWRENPASVVAARARAAARRRRASAAERAGGHRDPRRARACGCGPEALGVALYIGAQVRPPLRVTRGQGATFRVSRRYASDRQALAFQYVLDRLQSSTSSPGRAPHARSPSRRRRTPRARTAAGPPGMTDAIRTPDVLLDGLPGFDWAPSFRTWDGLRLAHVDVGDGSPVVMIHGEPTWSYLWRKVAPPVLEAGHRVILPDLPGLRPLGQADGRGLVLLRPPHGGDHRPASRRSTCATRRSCCTTGAARSGCGSRSSSRSGWARLVLDGHRRCSPAASR